MTRRNNISGIVLALTLATFLAPAPAAADGGFFAPWQSEIYETDQIAFIAHDSETNIEDLHILPKFYGDTADFAWVIPVPSLPELNESDLQIFRDCSYISMPVWRSRDGAWGCSETDYAVMADGRNDVQIIEQELVGIYDTMIIAATNASALTDSLSAWGFLHEDNQEEAEAIFASYVERSWYFVTLRIDASAIEDPYADYWYGGGIDPIRLTFASEDIVYPMKISAISAANLTDVVLYVAADSRMTFPGAETTYANRISASELSAIRSTYRALGAHLQEDMFLTRLKRVFSPAEMDEDIVLEAAARDTELHLIHYSGFPVGFGLIILIMAFCRYQPGMKKEKNG